MRYRWIPVLLLCSCSLPWTQGRSRTTVGWKQVMEKREPVYLIAIDRTECTVTKEKFAQIKPGDSVFCAWRVSSVQ